MTAHVLLTSTFPNSSVKILSDSKPAGCHTSALGSFLGFSSSTCQNQNPFIYLLKKLPIFFHSPSWWLEPPFLLSNSLFTPSSTPSWSPALLIVCQYVAQYHNFLSTTIILLGFKLSPLFSWIKRNITNRPCSGSPFHFFPQQCCPSALIKHASD